MHLLNVIQCSNLGGMEQASLRLMHAFKLRGHSVSLISLQALGALSSQLRKADIPAIGLHYGKASVWSLIWQLRRELRKQRPDVLLLTGHSLPVLLAVAGTRSIPRILAIHSHHTGVKPRWFWRLYYYMARYFVAAVTFPSDFVRLEALQFCPQLSAKAHTLRNPISPVLPFTTAERLSARDRFGLPPCSPVVGNAGWLIGRKRFDVFLRTATAVLRDRPDVRFLIAGDGPQREHLHSMASSLGIQHALVWSGWIKDMRPLYAALDILLFNSDWDALPTTPIEAAVHGVPVVCSLIHGGLAEVMQPEVDLFLIDRHDVSTLSTAVLDVLADPVGAKARASKARDRLLALSDPNMLVDWHESTFARAVCP